jgi:hypothetical protein
MITVIAEVFHVDDEALVGKAHQSLCRADGAARHERKRPPVSLVITAGHDVPEALFTGRD